jgi:hypothetical protein
MYVTISRQSKHGGGSKVYSGGTDTRFNYAPSEEVTIFYKYELYEEGITWSSLSTSMSSDEFDRLYEAGQRLFWLETDCHTMAVCITEPPNYHEYELKSKNNEKDAQLLDDLVIYCENFLNGFLNHDEFSNITKAFDEYLKDRQVTKLEEIITKIETENDIRLENKSESQSV